MPPILSRCNQPGRDARCKLFPPGQSLRKGDHHLPQEPAPSVNDWCSHLHKSSCTDSMVATNPTNSLWHNDPRSSLLRHMLNSFLAFGRTHDHHGLPAGQCYDNESVHQFHNLKYMNSKDPNLQLGSPGGKEWKCKSFHPLLHPCISFLQEFHRISEDVSCAHSQNHKSLSRVASRSRHSKHNLSGTQAKIHNLSSLWLHLCTLHHQMLQASSLEFERSFQCHMKMNRNPR
mmetsp:Transcript_99009/g.176382  ORF Transcript_99009/g.176382 Transcript_99009/m.176382 type:complete len:231 (+) Transcript_99009:1522-2214(+)